MNMRKKNMRIFFGLCVVLAWSCQVGSSQCPKDSARRAQQCFTDLARGVAATVSSDNDNIDNNDIEGVGRGKNDIGHDPRPGDDSRSPPGMDGGGMPLDYRKIGQYCAEDGHMPRFMRCVEELSLLCPNLPPKGALRQLINPDRVRTSVPNLCDNVNEVEANAECMNKEMNQHTPCKEYAYSTIRSGISLTTSNNTAMFFLQCRFFSVLAECQRKALSEECGGNLGDLHADFLLSFVPKICTSDTAPAPSEGQDSGDDPGTEDSQIDGIKNDSTDFLQKGDSDTASQQEGGSPLGDLQDGGDINEDDDKEDDGESLVEGNQTRNESQAERKTSEKTRLQNETEIKEPSIAHIEDNVYQEVLKTLPSEVTQTVPAGKSQESLKRGAKIETSPSSTSIFSTASAERHRGYLLLTAPCWAAVLSYVFSHV